MKNRTTLFSLFVDRPVLTTMAAIAILLVGVISFGKLPLRFAPEGLSENELNIWIPVSDRTPTEVEDKITIPVEEQLRTIPGIKEIGSESESDSSRLWVTLDEGMDPVLAAAEVRDRLQRARLEWPEDVENYYTWREDASSAPLAFFQMLTPERNNDWDVLLDKVVRPRLEAVEGVGRVEIWGLLEETIRIWFDRDKLIAHQVDYYRLMQKLSGDNFAEPVGELDDADSRFMLRVDAKFKTEQDILDYPVSTGLVLSDIARVERVPSIRNSLSRFNQKYTYSGMIRAAAAVNPAEASANLRDAIAQLHRDPRLKELEFRFLFDQGEMIQESLDTLLTTSLQGGILALIALIMFLRNLRFTIAIALAIPMALLIVGAWLFFTGDSLNILTMAGMTLAVGMVVDNSVVVLENIRRIAEKGTPLRDACVEGAREVALAVSMATLTTVVMILPMVFMGNGQARILLGSVGIPLSVALVGSLGVALLLLPSGMRHFGKSASSRERPAPRWMAALSPVTWLMKFNRALLGVSLRHRFTSSLVALGLLSTCNYPFQQMDFSAGSGSPFSRGDIAIHLELPKGLGLAEVEQEIIAYEDFVLARKDEWRIDSVSARFSRRSASIDIGLDSDVPRDEFSDYRAKIEKAWPRRAGVKVRLRDTSDSMGGGRSSEKEERSFVMRLYGRDSEFLMSTAQRVQARLQELEEVATVEIPALDDNLEVVVQLDRDRMQELQVRQDILQGTVSSGLQGRVLTEFDEFGRETKLIAEFDSERNPTMLDLKETRIMAGSSFQRLADISEIGFQKSMGSIDRTDGRTQVSLVGRRAEGTGPLAFSQALGSVMQEFPLPRGYSWSEDSAFLETQVQLEELTYAGILGLVLVFLLMAILFESLILPFSIFWLMPSSVVGAAWSLYLFYGELDAMAYVGGILLMGIVVNNGIVLMDCISRLRQEGWNREEAIVEGTRRRLRPIVMTAVTTFVGLLPMAMFGDSSGQGLSYVSLSITVAGGLAICTMITAGFVPLIYTLLDDLEAWIKRAFFRAVPRQFATRNQPQSAPGA